MKAFLTDIKVAIDAKRLSDALNLCGEATKLADGDRNFLLQSTGGQCAFQTSKFDLAEQFLLRASLCDAPPPQIQKNWKVVCYCIFEKVYVICLT